MQIESEPSSNAFDKRELRIGCGKTAVIFHIGGANDRAPRMVESFRFFDLILSQEWRGCSKRVLVPMTTSVNRDSERMQAPESRVSSGFKAFPSPKYPGRPRLMKSDRFQLHSKRLGLGGLTSFVFAEGDEDFFEVGG